MKASGSEVGAHSALTVRAFAEGDAARWSRVVDIKGIEKY